jgi:hypothetical protein
VTRGEFKLAKRSADRRRRFAQAESLALLLTVVAVVLIPWTAWLAVRLPTTHLARHWDVAWVGFDIALTATVGATGIALWWQARAAPFLATAAGTLLLADTWFDTLTARGGDELDVAIAIAVGAELPLAALCFWLAQRWARRRAGASPPEPT